MNIVSNFRLVSCVLQLCITYFLGSANAELQRLFHDLFVVSIAFIELLLRIENIIYNEYVMNNFILWSVSYDH